MSRLEGIVPILDVRDVNAALVYYVQRLGFEVAFRYEDDPDNYAGVKRDAVYLDMQWQHADDFDRGTAGNLRLRILVDDPDALFAELTARGALDATVTVHETMWGTREFGFRDPDGNGLTFYRNV